MQTLHVPGAGKVVVDRMFRDDGTPAVLGMLGNQRIVLNVGTPPKITVAQCGKAFFFLDAQQSPVRTLEDIDVIPPTSPFRKAAEDFVALQQTGGRKAEQVLKHAKPAKPKRRILHDFTGKRGLEKAMEATGAADPKLAEATA